MGAIDRFENYEVLRRADGSLFELGRGGMGVTYKAWDTDLHCHAALKVILPELLETIGTEERFLREARAAARLRHPNIAAVYRLGKTADQSIFYAMEFCEGPTLAQAVAQRGPFSAAEALRIACQVCKALVVAEQHQLVHRDLKPANLILTERPDDGLVVKVIDFGLAKGTGDGQQSLATLGTMGFVGTAHFASPEQLEGAKLDARSDLYSLGGCLWFMLVGKPMFPGTLAQILKQTLSGEPSWDKLAGQPEAVVAVLRRLVARDREQRPATAAVALRALEEASRAIEGKHVGADLPPVVNAAAAAPFEAETPAKPSASAPSSDSSLSTALAEAAAPAPAARTAHLPLAFAPLVEAAIAPVPRRVYPMPSKGQLIGAAAIVLLLGAVLAAVYFSVLNRVATRGSQTSSRTVSSPPPSTPSEAPAKDLGARSTLGPPVLAADPLPRAASAEPERSEAAKPPEELRTDPVARGFPEASAPAAEPPGGPPPPTPFAMPDLYPGESHPETRLRELTAEEVGGWKDSALYTAIQEIYARHGASFQNSSANAYYTGRKWSEPLRGARREAIEAAFTPFERNNLKMLFAEFRARKLDEERLGLPSKRTDAR